MRNHEQTVQGQFDPRAHAYAQSAVHCAGPDLERADIYLLRNGDHTESVAIIAAEPRQLTIVNIVGSIDLARLARLQGQFGVPRVGITMNGQVKDDPGSTRAQ